MGGYVLTSGQKVGVDGYIERMENLLGILRRDDSVCAVLTSEVMEELVELAPTRPCEVAPGCHNAEPFKPCCIDRGMEPM